MIKEIEQLHEHICDECQNGLYYPPKEYQESSRRIFNAATILYNESICVYRDKAEYGKKTKLSLKELVNLLHKICEILQQAENWITKEVLVKNTLEQNNIASKDFLKLDTWQGDFVEKLEK